MHDEDPIGDALATYVHLTPADQASMLVQLALQPADALRTEHATALAAVLGQFAASAPVAGGDEIALRAHAPPLSADALSASGRAALVLAARALPSLRVDAAHNGVLCALLGALGQWAWRLPAHAASRVLAPCVDASAAGAAPSIEAGQLVELAAAAAQALAAAPADGPLAAVAIASLALQCATRARADARGALTHGGLHALRACWPWLTERAHAPTAARARLQPLIVELCASLPERAAAEEAAPLYNVLAALAQLSVAHAASGAGGGGAALEGGGRAAPPPGAASADAALAMLAQALRAVGSGARRAAEAAASSDQALAPPAASSAVTFFAAKLHALAACVSALCSADAATTAASAASAATTASATGRGNECAAALLHTVGACMAAYHTMAEVPRAARGAAREQAWANEACEEHARAHVAQFAPALASAMRARAQMSPAAGGAAGGGAAAGAGGCWLALALVRAAEARAARARHAERAAPSAARDAARRARGLCLCACAILRAPQPADVGGAVAALPETISLRCALALVRLLPAARVGSARAPRSLERSVHDALGAFAARATQPRAVAVELLAALPALRAHRLVAEAVGIALAHLPDKTRDASGAYARDARVLAVRQALHEADTGGDSGADSDSASDSDSEFASESESDDAGDDANADADGERRAAAARETSAAGKALDGAAADASALARALCRTAVACAWHQARGGAPHGNTPLLALLPPLPPIGVGGGGGGLGATPVPLPPRHAELALGARAVRWLRRAAPASLAHDEGAAMRQALLDVWLPAAAASLLLGWHAPAPARAAGWQLAASVALLPPTPRGAAPAAPAAAAATLAARLPAALAHAAANLTLCAAGRRLIRALGAAASAFLAARWLADRAAIGDVSRALAAPLRAAVRALGASGGGRALGAAGCAHGACAWRAALALADAAHAICATLPHSALADSPTRPLAAGPAAPTSAEAEVGGLFSSLLALAHCGAAGVRPGGACETAADHAPPRALAVRAHARLCARLERRARGAAAALTELGRTADASVVRAVASALPAVATAQLRSCLDVPPAGARAPWPSTAA
ncbi:hypothetical protein KFE25_004200 [Diacronema lutheri]|uniref:Uncharacterized protein n=1 Tax=Diacronema lutheri TaxID=2081491 RepID=A0A8J5X5I9_DIALT|nr:hypothetical protein KFE25_004200 [Diacronema lutheri]